MEETALVREYRLLLTALDSLQLDGVSASTVEEDELLDEMDSVWHRMTKAERSMF